MKMLTRLSDPAWRAAQPGGVGRWLLGATAAGFVAYGCYQIIHARYSHIQGTR
jgi:hypothetical protein